VSAEPRQIGQKGDRFEAYGLGYRAVMGDGTIRMTVRRLRHDHGSLRGYVDVEFRAKGTPRGTPPTRLAGEVVNLSSGRDRTQFANRLAERKAGIDWRNLVDGFCVEVERRDDEAEPAVWIGNLPAPIDGGWLVEGMLERNQNNEIHGDGSVGKSWLALALAVSVTTGLEILPGYRPMLRGNVLYLDWETDHDTLNLRVQQIARGAGIDPPNILYLRMDGPFADAVERVLALCQEHGIVLVIIDSMEAAMAGSIAAGAPPNEGPSKINRGLRRLGRITSFLVDHISAEQAQQRGVARKAYGNIFKRNWVRLAFQLKQAREPNGDEMNHLGLFCAKRNNGREYDPVGLRWEINDEVCRWAREDIADPELEEALPTAERIAAYLRREGPSQPSAIGEATGIKSATVRSTLARSPRFEKNERGLWGIVAEVTEPTVEEDEEWHEPDPLPFD
jgi:hypothetical protein